MENLVRLLLRFLLVPLGFVVAAIVGSLVVMIATWELISVATSGRPLAVGDAVIAAVFGSALLTIFVMVFMLLPASIGILISEGFAIRSWIFHVLNGVASAWLGVQFYNAAAGQSLLHGQPLVIAGAGIAAGFAYWAVAGFSAGFYKPVFRRDLPPVVPATTR